MLKSDPNQLKIPKSSIQIRLKILCQAHRSSQRFTPTTTSPTLQITRGRAVARLCRYNPPAHPKDGPGACWTWPVPSIPTLPYRPSRDPPRQSPPPPCFVFFSISHFPLKMAVFWRLQGSQNRPKTVFWAKSWLPKLIFLLFFGCSCFCRAFWSFGDRFLMIFR